MKKIGFVVLILFEISIANCQTCLEDKPVLKGPYFGQKLSGNSPELFAREVFDKEKQAHSVIAFSKDGTEAYWCSDGIRYSKFEQGNWTIPRLVPFSIKEYGDDAPFLSPDGSLLFFTSKRPLTLSDTGNKENIWVAKVLDSGWSAPQPLPPAINDMFQHWQFSVDNNGTIYFGHIRNGDINNDRDIYYSKLVNGEYLMPEKLDNSVNSEYNDQNPFIDPDGDYLIFVRIKERKPHNGGLYISFKMKDGSWSVARPIGEKIHFNYGGNCPFVTQDGKYLFFLDNYNGHWQRYWVSAGFFDELNL